jgi:hypothetical protein
MRSADVVVVLGRCMRERVIARGIKPNHIEMINVWADPNEISVRCQSENPLRDEWGISDEFVIEYSGNFGVGHDERAMLAAMDALKDQSGLRWVVVGGGTKKAELENFVRQHLITNVILRQSACHGRCAPCHDGGGV